MAKTMIIYDLDDKNKVKKTSVIRALFGYKDKSYHGKYEYQRPGLLSKIKYKRVKKTVLLVEKKDEEEVLKILKKLDISPVVVVLK